MDYDYVKGDAYRE